MTVLLSSRKTCKDKYTHETAGYCNDCNDKFKGSNCERPFYYEADVLATVKKLKKDIQYHVDNDNTYAKIIGLNVVLKMIDSVFGVPEQSEATIPKKEAPIPALSFNGSSSLGSYSGSVEKKEDWQCPNEDCLSSCRCCCDCPEQSETGGEENGGYNPSGKLA